MSGFSDKVDLLLFFYISIEQMHWVPHPSHFCEGWENIHSHTFPVFLTLHPHFESPHRTPHSGESRSLHSPQKDPSRREPGVFIPR
jgi:hypothetical protein